MTEPKAYASNEAMKRAIKNQGLLTPYRVDQVQRTLKHKTRTCYMPVFQCELAEDVTELQRRGFAAEKAPGKYLGKGRMTFPSLGDLPPRESVCSVYMVDHDQIDDLAILRTAPFPVGEDREGRGNIIIEGNPE